MIRNIARYKEQKAKNPSRSTRRSSSSSGRELNADKEEEEAIDKHSDMNDGGIERDYYLDEALAITTDYLNLHNVANVQRAVGVQQ